MFHCIQVMGLGEYWYRLVYWCRLGNNRFNRNFKLHILTWTILNVLVTLNNFNKSIGRRSTLTGNHLRFYPTQYVHQDINFHEKVHILLAPRDIFYCQQSLRGLFSHRSITLVLGVPVHNSHLHNHLYRLFRLGS